MFRSINLLIAIALACATFGLARSASCEEPEKPLGFSGYLLDASGLEQEKEASWRETFETEGVSWRYAYQDGAVRVTEHRRVEDYAREGRRSEKIVYKVDEQGVVVFAHYVDYPTVYEETAPALWVRSNRPGVAIAALVVFPKTPRPDSRKPLVAIIPGEKYGAPGEWRKLGFPQGLATAVEKVAQSVRGEHKLPVNVEGAYVRQILLLSEARSGEYELWVDDLEIGEHLRPELESLRQWERDAAFDPINLLSCRLQLSNAPIFAQDDVEDSDAYGREPFAIDEKKAAENSTKKLVFTPEALESVNKAPREPPVPTFENDFKPEFETAYSIIKPTQDDYFAALDELAPRRANMLDATNLNAANRTISRDSAVGQVSFLDAPRADDDSQNETQNVELVARRDDDETDLVFGSGTLANPEDAASEAFVQKGERLVANVRFNNGALESTVDKRVYAIRAIEYQGESFEFLKKLGFNAIWLGTPPTAEQLKAANDVGIWLIAPPPRGAQVVDDSAVDPNAPVQSASGRTNDDFGGRRVGTAYDPVLMWHMGADLRRDQVASLQRRVERIRALDPLARPTIGSVSTGVDEYADDDRLNALLLRRAPILTSLDLNAYGEWLLRYKDLATHPRAVFWNTIQTQPGPTATMQRQFFSMVDESPGIVSYEQMRQLVRLSMRAKCRGLVFSSYSPLDGKDHKTQYRAAALEAINLELQLVAPWFAMGEPRANLLPTSIPTMSGVVSDTKRAALVAPISLDVNNQYVMGRDAFNNLSTTVSVKEGYAPDLLTPGALRKIIARRRAGGSFVTLEEASMNSLLFFTQSDSVSQKISERAPIFGERMAKLAISLARKRLDLYEETVYGLHYVEEHGLFPKSAPPAPALGDVVERAGALIDEAEIYLQRRDASQAYLVAERATREIRNIERLFWAEATKNEIARPVTPLSTSFYDMPAYLELYDKLLSGKLRQTGPNLIGGGEMEDSQTWQASGWKVYNEASDVLKGVVSFDSRAAKNGQTGMRIVVSGVSADKYVPRQTETPIVYVEVPFTAQVGDLVCIQGWIKIPNELTNSVDGVEIYDDQGGEALALRFKNQTDWKHFAFYRRSTNSGLMRLRFAFTGVGEVHLDDVAAYVVR